MHMVLSASQRLMYPHKRLVYLGLLKPARDFARFHETLGERGLLVATGEATVGTPPRLDDMERSVRAIRELLGTARVSAVGDRGESMAAGARGGGKG